MCSGKILSELLDEPMHVKVVLTISEMLANRQPTMWKGKPIQAGEFITSIASMMRYASATHRQVRFAFARLEALGKLRLNTEDRQFTRVLVLSNVTEKDTEKDTENVTEKRTKTRIKSNSSVTEKVTGKVTEKVNSSSSVVSAVSRSSPAFDVPHSGSSIDKKDSLSAKTPTAPSPLEKFKDDFNRQCPRLIACRSLTDKRRKKIRAELAEYPDPLYWDEVFRVANKSAFLSGDNDRRWRANFDFIIRCHVEIVEGKYSRPSATPAVMPRELPSANKIEEQADLSPDEIKEMHLQTVATVYRGVCRTKDCKICLPAAAVTADELEELPV